MIFSNGLISCWGTAIHTGTNQTSVILQLSYTYSNMNYIALKTNIWDTNSSGGCFYRMVSIYKEDKSHVKTFISNDADVNYLCIGY